MIIAITTTANTISLIPCTARRTPGKTITSAPLPARPSRIYTAIDLDCWIDSLGIGRRWPKPSGNNPICWDMSYSTRYGYCRAVGYSSRNLSNRWIDRKIYSCILISSSQTTFFSSPPFAYLALVCISPSLGGRYFLLFPSNIILLILVGSSINTFVKEIAFICYSIQGWGYLL